MSTNFLKMYLYTILLFVRSVFNKTTKCCVFFSYCPTLQWKRFRSVSFRECKTRRLRRSRLVCCFFPFNHAYNNGWMKWMKYHTNLTYNHVHNRRTNVLLLLKTRFWNFSIIRYFISISIYIVKLLYKTRTNYVNGPQWRFVLKRAIFTSTICQLTAYKTNKRDQWIENWLNDLNNFFLIMM